MLISFIEYFAVRAILVDSIKLKSINVAVYERHTHWELTRYYTSLTGYWLEMVMIS